MRNTFSSFVPRFFSSYTCHTACTWNNSVLGCYTARSQLVAALQGQSHTCRLLPGGSCTDTSSRSDLVAGLSSLYVDLMFWNDWLVLHDVTCFTLWWRCCWRWPNWTVVVIAEVWFATVLTRFVVDVFVTAIFSCQHFAPTRKRSNVVVCCKMISILIFSLRSFCF